MVKNQHYIPQFYLKRFGTNNKIDVYDINNKKFITNSNVSNFACARFFYDIDLNTLEETLNYFNKFPNIKISEKIHAEARKNPQFIEKALSRLESKMSTYLDKIENDYSLITDEEFLCIFFIFIRTSAIRTIGFRKQLENITTQTSNWLEELGIKECSDYPIDMNPKELAKLEQLEYLISPLSLLEKSVTFFDNYNIFIGINKTDLGFIISNEPFIYFEQGFNDICFPINPHLAIIMQVKNVEDSFLICHSKPNESNIINLKLADIISYNILQNHQMSKYLFGKKIDIENMLKIIKPLNKLTQLPPTHM